MKTCKHLFFFLSFSVTNGSYSHMDEEEDGELYAHEEFSSTNQHSYLQERFVFMCVLFCRVAIQSVTEINKMYLCVMGSLKENLLISWLNLLNRKPEKKKLKLASVRVSMWMCMFENNLSCTVAWTVKYLISHYLFVEQSSIWPTCCVHDCHRRNKIN